MEQRDNQDGSRSPSCHTVCETPAMRIFSTLKEIKADYLKSQLPHKEKMTMRIDEALEKISNRTIYKADLDIIENLDLATGNRAKDR